MKRRREQRSVRSSAVTSPKTPNKKQKQQQDASNGKAENDETNERPTVAATGSGNKKSN